MVQSLSLLVHRSFVGLFRQLSECRNAESEKEVMMMVIKMMAIIMIVSSIISMIGILRRSYENDT